MIPVLPSMVGPYPFKGSLTDRLGSIVRLATLAPSPLNTQPWLFKVVDEELRVYADRSRQLKIHDPDGRDMTLAIGGAIYAIRLAMTCFLMEAEVQYLPDPNDPELMAVIRCVGDASPTRYELHLLTMMSQRHSAHGHFEDREVSASVLDDLADAARTRSTSLRFVGHGALRRAIGDIVLEATANLMNDTGYRHELAQWLRPNPENAIDGLPPEAIGVPRPFVGVASWIVDHFDIGYPVGMRARDEIFSAPALGILWSRDDETATRLQAGEALMHLLLATTAEGLSAAFHSAPLSLAHTRFEIGEEAGIPGYAQAILRLGHLKTASAASHRRPVGEVLECHQACKHGQPCPNAKPEPCTTGGASI